MTRILCPPTVSEIPGPRPTPGVTCSSVCARGTAEESGSANDMPHFTPRAWVRTDNIPVSILPGSVRGEECVPETHVVRRER